MLLEDEGHALLFVPFANYCEHNLDAALAMMRDANSVIGLGDGGAHYGLICDASYPTTLLAHWARDRDGERVSLSWAIKALASDTAELVGLHDRGRISVGMKADMNLIDHGRMRLFAPRSKPACRVEGDDWSKTLKVTAPLSSAVSSRGAMAGPPAHCPADSFAGLRHRQRGRPGYDSIGRGSCRLHSCGSTGDCRSACSVSRSRDSAPRIFSSTT